jgi:phospholipase/lecithinase/hemolysin
MAGRNLFVFGDSLSDTGRFFAFTTALGMPLPPSPPYFNGHLSNGPVAVEWLAAQPKLGLTLNPANNYAFTGATTGQGNSNEDDLGGIDLPGLQDQINSFTAKARTEGVDKKGVYVVWAGPNNFLDTLGGETTADPAVLLQQGTRDLMAATDTLASLGIHTIVLPNMVNLGRLPASAQSRTEATAITKAFNGAVALAVGNLDYRVTEVDLFSTGEAVAADPARFGFTNVTDPLLFLQSGSTPPSNPEQFFFWDLYHPTTQGHAVLADTIGKTLTGKIRPPQFVDRPGTNRSDWIMGTSAQDNIDGFGGWDHLSGGGGDDRIEGWSGNDLLAGNQGNDLLSGGDGDDAIWGGDGQDIGFGGNGNDLLVGLAADDILVGDAGQDVIQGGQGKDYLLGGEGDDHLWGNSEDDILDGGMGHDTLWGDDGNDILNGNVDSDKLTGGRGKDQFVYRLGNGKDRITDFLQGEDYINLVSFGFTSFENFKARVDLSNDDLNFGNGNILQLTGINATSLSATDFRFA